MNIGKISGNLVSDTIIHSERGRAADDSFEKHLETAVEKNDQEEMKKACQEFESIFLSMVYKQMKASIPKSGLIPKDAGAEIFESMLDEKLMEEAAKGRGIGLADTLYKQLSGRLNATGKSDNIGEKNINENE
jgi:flagellar protein FlgJ